MVEVGQLLFLGFGAVLLIGGVKAIQKGRFYTQQSDRIAETEVTDVDSIEPGTAAVKGTARVDEDEGTVTTALSGEEALLSHSEVVVKDEDTGDEEPGTPYRRTVHEQTQSVPFLLEDETGTIRVDPPEEADTRLTENVSRKVGHSYPDAADLADRPEEAVSGTVPVDDQYPNSYERRYEQAALRPGESVYVLGETADIAGWEGIDFEITGGEHPERFIVADTTKENVQTGGKLGAYLLYILGGVVSLVGLLLLLGMAVSLL